MIGLIADDLTGACDTGVQFGRAGFTTWVSVAAFARSSFHQRGFSDLRFSTVGFDHRSADGFARGVAQRDDLVVAVNTESRHDSPDVAADKVMRAADLLAKAGMTTVYKKIDSALRGNVAAEVGALMRKFPDRLVLIAPAYPDQGRTTLAGHQLVHGVRVSESEFAHDALTPVTESHIPTILTRDASGGSCEVHADEIYIVSLAALRQGDRLVLQIPTGIRCIVFDAVLPSDLTRIAQFAARALDQFILVGTAGLAQALAGVLAQQRAVASATIASGSTVASDTVASGSTVATDAPDWAIEATLDAPDRAIEADSDAHLTANRANSDAQPAVIPVAPPTPTTNRPALIVSGSMKEISRRQIDHAVDRGGRGAALVVVPVSEIQRDIEKDVPLAVSVARLAPLLAKRIIRALQAGGDVVLTVEPPAEPTTDRSQQDVLAVSHAINETLGQTTARVFEHFKDVQDRLGGLILNGGDTALSVCGALGVDTLNLHEEVFPGVVHSTAAEGAIPFVLKSGGFGEITTLVELLEKLKQREHGLDPGKRDV